MPGQVAQGAYAARIGIGSAHGKGIAIVEPQWHRDAKARRCQRTVHGIEAQRRGAFKDFQRNGAGVFGIQVDVARTQGRIDDSRVAKPLAHYRRGGQVRRCRLSQHLGQHVRLGKSLGSDAKGVGRVGWSGDKCAAKNADAEQGEEVDWTDAWHRSSLPIAYGAPEREWP